jgi:hypothetical protein
LGRERKSEIFWTKGEKSKIFLDEGRGWMREGVGETVYGQGNIVRYLKLNDCILK